MNPKMTYHIILLVLAVFIFFLVFYMLWKYGRISRQDVLALTAVIISISIGVFTFLSRSLPIEIEVYHTSTTLFNLPEENKSLLLSEALYFDLKNHISSEAKIINQQLLAKRIDVDILDKKTFMDTLKGSNFNYNIPLGVLKSFYGKSPCSVPIVISLSFVNKTPNPVTIDELYVIIKSQNDMFIYKPMFFVDSKILFTNNFKKTSEIFSNPFHPFLLTENSDKELHLFCIKWNMVDKDNIQNTKELNIDDYKLELHYHTGDNKKYKEALPSIKITEKTLIDLYNGGKISISNESNYYKEILKDNK